MIHLSRRAFLQSSALTALVAALPIPLLAAEEKVAEETLLRAVSRTIEVKGKAAKVFGLIGPDGKHGLSFTAGERFRVKLQNEAGEPTLIHWHGLTPPWRQDGVPGVSQPLLPSGQSYTYDFPLERPGTNWMHAHTLQEQSMMAAPLIIREVNATDEQEVVVLLHDFSFRTPQEILAALKAKKPDPHAVMDHDKMPMDVNDVAYDAFLANDRTLEDPEVVKVEAGGRVRLRIINAAASTGFTIDLGALEGELIAVDGMEVKPLRGKFFPLAMAQRADIRLQLPKGNAAYPVLALQQAGSGRCGIILAAPEASIGKIESFTESKGPLLDLTMEEKLMAVTPLAVRPVDLAARFALRGTMAPYQWSLPRLEPTPGEGLDVKAGQRVEITFHNQSMMAHPIHLHGHHFQVMSINGKPVGGALRDTILLLPHGRVVVAFDADNSGKWPLHCHHLFHMVSGMMTFATYEGITA